MPAKALRRGSAPPTRAAKLSGVKPMPQVLVAKKPTVMTTVKKRAPSPHSSESSEDDSSSNSDVSEEYRPLAFGFIKGYPTRKRGAPSGENDLTARTSWAETNTNLSLSLSLSDEERPLAVQVGKDGAKRRYGQIDTYGGAKRWSEQGVEELTPELTALPTTTEARARAASGRARNSRAAEMYHFEQIMPASEGDEEENETPLTAELILNLVRRLRTEPHQEIPLEAFQLVNWGDENYQLELKPLQKVYEFMEAKAYQIKGASNKPMEKSLVVRFDKKIKEAIVALPEEKAIVARIAKVNKKELRTSTYQGHIYSGGEKAPELVAATAQKQGNHGKILPSGSKAASGQAVSKFEAPEAHVRKMGDSILVSGKKKKQKWKEASLSASYSYVAKLESSIIRSNAPKLAVKESQFGEAAKKHRAKRVVNRSATFTDVVTPEPHEEIVEGKEENSLAPVRKHSDVSQHNNVSSRPAPAAVAEPSKVPRKGNKKQHTRRSSANVSFSAIPDYEEGNDIPEDDSALKGTAKTAKPKKKTRHQRKALPGQSVTFTDLIIEEAGELSEKAPDQFMNSAPSQTSKRTPSEGGDSHKGKRPYRAHSREISMTDLEFAVAGEIYENDELVPSRSSRQDSRNSSRVPTRVGTPGTGKGSRTVSRVGEVPAQNITDDVVSALNVPSRPIPKPPASPVPATVTRKGRKRMQRKHVSQEISISALPEEYAGEISENDHIELNQKPGQQGFAQTTRSTGNSLLPSVSNGRASTHRSDTPPARASDGNNVPALQFHYQGSKMARTTPPPKLPSSVFTTPKPTANPRQTASLPR